ATMSFSVGYPPELATHTWNIAKRSSSTRPRHGGTSPRTTFPWTRNSSNSPPQCRLRGDAWTALRFQRNLPSEPLNQQIGSREVFALTTSSLAAPEIAAVAP